MFEIGRLFHLTQVVDDLDAADSWYSEVFSALRIYRGRHDAALRDASILVIGNAVIEVIQVADAPGASETPIGKYHDRFGQHMHSVAMFVDDLGDVGESLGAHGVRMTDTLGRKITERRPDRTVWTHPRDTVVMLQFATVPTFNFDPRLHPFWSDEHWRRHPLGIERLSHCTVLVKDMTRAMMVFGEVLGRPLLSIEESGESQATATFSFGPDLNVRLLEPRDHDSPEGSDLARNGEGPFGFTFLVRDLDAAQRHLESCGQSFRRSCAQEVTIDPSDAFGLSLSLIEAPS